MNFAVIVTPEAEDDLDRLLDDLIGRSKTVEDLRRIPVVENGIRSAIASLGTSAPRCRKCLDDSTLRELIIPHGASGYLALFKIDGDRVFVLALRHQLESDYH